VPCNGRCHIDWINIGLLGNPCPPPNILWGAPGCFCIPPDVGGPGCGMDPCCGCSPCLPICQVAPDGTCTATFFACAYCDADGNMVPGS
jgi:hypothetical protein